MNSVLKTVQSEILNSNDHNRIWSYADFENLPYDSVLKALSLLARKQVINRAHKGFYYVPKQTILDPSILNPESLIFKTIAKKANFYCISGILGFNKIGLTTQVPNRLMIACDYPFRSTKDVQFLLRNKPHSGTELERIVLDAIIDLDRIPDTTPGKTINKIKKFITSERLNIDDLGQSALKEPPRARAVVGALGEELAMDKDLLAKLNKTLNPGTSYFINLMDELKYSKNWNIKKKKINGR